LVALFPLLVTVRYSTGKFIRRNRTGVVACGPVGGYAGGSDPDHGLAAHTANVPRARAEHRFQEVRGMPTPFCSHCTTPSPTCGGPRRRELLVRGAISAEYAHVPGRIKKELGEAM
jgi:hypothetical protein